MTISYRSFGTKYHTYFKCRLIGYQHSGEHMYCLSAWIMGSREHKLGGKAPSCPHSDL